VLYASRTGVVDRIDVGRAFVPHFSQPSADYWIRAHSDSGDTMMMSLRVDY